MFQSHFYNLPRKGFGEIVQLPNIEGDYMQVFVKHLGYKSHKGGKVSKGLSSIKAHMKYIKNRQDEQGNRYPRPMFSKEGQSDIKSFYEILKKQPERGVIAHKLVISMDRKDLESQKIDLQELAKDTMAAWEAKTGRKLNWIACVHDKKSNPHVHIVLAGRDENRKEVSIMKHDLEKMKKISDQQREAQAERNFERGEFDPIKQIEYEKIFDKQLEKQQLYHNRAPEMIQDREKFYDLER